MPKDNHCLEVVLDNGNSVYIDYKSRLHTVRFSKGRGYRQKNGCLIVKRLWEMEGGIYHEKLGSIWIQELWDDSSE